MVPAPRREGRSADARGGELGGWPVIRRGRGWEQEEERGSSAGGRGRSERRKAGDRKSNV